VGTTGIGAITDMGLTSAVEAFDLAGLCSGSAVTVGLVPGEAVPEACTAAAEAAGSGALVVAAAAGQLPG